MIKFQLINAEAKIPHKKPISLNFWYLNLCISSIIAETVGKINLWIRKWMIRTTWCCKRILFLRFPFIRGYFAHTKRPFNAFSIWRRFNNLTGINNYRLLLRAPLEPCAKGDVFVQTCTSRPYKSVCLYRILFLYTYFFFFTCWR